MNYESKDDNESTQSPGGGDGEATPGPFKNNRTEINVMDPSTRPQFVGLSKEELARYENDPFWKKVRLGLLLAFWAIWLILLIAAILLLVRTPKCPTVYNLKWSRKSPGYVISIDKFTAPLVGHTGDPAAQLSALANHLSYVKNLDFGYVVLYDDVSNENLSAAELFKPLRERANALGMQLVLEVENKDVCPQLALEDGAECVALRELIDKILIDYDFDGISVPLDLENQKGFTPLTIEFAKKQMDSIGKSTLRPRSLIAYADSGFDGLKADLKVSNLLTSWKEKSDAGEIVSMIAASKGCTGWMLDSMRHQSLIADPGRDLDTNLALHIVYLLPGTPIITYGTESFIKSGQCWPPVMPWNSSVWSNSADCRVQDDVNLYNVKRISANGYPNSPYRLIRKLSKLRADYPIFTFGTVSSLKQFNNKVVYWEIHEPLYPIIVVLVNIGKNGTVVPLESPTFQDKTGCHLKIIYQSETDWTINDEIQCGGVYLKGNAVVVLQTKTTLQKKDSSSIQK